MLRKRYLLVMQLTVDRLGPWHQQPRCNRRSQQRNEDRLQDFYARAGRHNTCDNGEQGAAHLGKDKHERQRAGLDIGWEELGPQRHALADVSMASRELPGKTTRKGKIKVLTAANSGPVKKPTKLIAIEAAIMLGTLPIVSTHNTSSSPGVHLQPKYQLQSQRKHNIYRHHLPRPQPLRRLRQQHPAQQTAAVEASRHVSHLIQLAMSYRDKILNHPSASSQHGTEVEEVEGAQQPHAGRLERGLDDISCLGIRAAIVILRARRIRRPAQPQRIAKCKGAPRHVDHAQPQRERVKVEPARRFRRACRGNGRRQKRPDKAAGHVHGVNKGQPSVRLCARARDKRVSVRILKGLAQADYEESHDEQAKGRSPGTQRLRESLQDGAEGK